MLVQACNYTSVKVVTLITYDASITEMRLTFDLCSRRIGQISDASITEMNSTDHRDELNCDRLSFANLTNSDKFKETNLDTLVYRELGQTITKTNSRYSMQVTDIDKLCS